MATLPHAYLIFELKLDKTAEIAFTQAEHSQYKEQFCYGEKDILVIGLNCSSKSRNIAEWKASVFSPQGDLLRSL